MAREILETGLSYETDHNSNFDYDEDIKGNAIAANTKIKEIKDKVDSPVQSSPILNTRSIFTAGKGETLDISDSIIQAIIDARFSGQTMQNLVKNGDFSDGLTGITVTHGTATISNGVLEVTGSGTGSDIRVLFTTNAINTDGQIQTLATKTKVDNENLNRIQVISGNSSVSDYNSVVDKWNTIVKDISMESSDVGFERFEVRFVYGTEIEANGSKNYIDGNFGNFHIDKTALGIEDYTEEQMLDYVENADAGTIDLQFAKPQCVRSCGKNLADIMSFEGYDGDPILNNGSWNVSDSDKVELFIKPELDKVYSFQANSNTANGRIVIQTTDSDGVSISTYDTVGSGVLKRENISIDEGTALIRVALLGSGGPSTINNVQIEKGDTATEYELYKESLQFHTLEKKRLPNGVSDDEEYQRVSDVLTFTNSTGWTITAENTNTIEFFYADNRARLDTSTQVRCISNMFKNTNYGDVFSNPDLEAVSLHSTEPRIMLQINKSRLSTNDLSGLNDYLQTTPLQVAFELAEPIQRKENLQRLMAYENGTIDLIPRKQLIEVYNSGIDVGENIESLAYVSIIQGESETVLDVSDAIITTTSFTHTNLTDGDLVYVEYEYSGFVAMQTEFIFNLNLLSQVLSSNSAISSNADLINLLVNRIIDLEARVQTLEL